MGGILGSNEEGIITHYHFDNTGYINDNHEYIPDVKALNIV